MLLFFFTGNFFRANLRCRSTGGPSNYLILPRRPMARVCGGSDKMLAGWTERLHPFWAEDFLQKPTSSQKKNPDFQVSRDF